MKWALGAALALSASTAIAAPFCVVTSFGQQCWYYDFPSCQRAAAQARGACVAQQEQEPQRRAPEMPQLAPSGAPFCVVFGGGTNCFYYDAPTCRQAAASMNGMCVVNQNR